MPLILLKHKLNRYLLILLIIIPTITLAASNDSVQVVINSWLSNKPKMLLKLNIHLPQEGDQCFVLVRRFPTMYNPTPNGATEKIYAGVHNPGDTIVVSKLLNAYIASEEFDPTTSELKVAYYEPQEFFVAIACKENDRIVYKWSEIIEVRPTSIVYETDITPPDKPVQDQTIKNSQFISEPIQCSLIEDEYIPGTYRRGHCIVWVRGPMIYSMWNVDVSFGITHNSVVYIESFSDIDYGPFTKPESEVEWSSAGRKMTISIIDGETTTLSGPYKDRVYFKVKYVYEWGNECDSFAGSCYSYWLLYPVSIRNVQRSGVMSDAQIPNETSYYNPPSYCGSPDYVEIYPGNTRTIWFYDNTKPPYESNIPISSIAITFNLPSIWSATLSVDFYKAGRHDSQYTTPYVKITNNNNYPICWWFESDDPMTYTVKVGGQQARP